MVIKVGIEIELASVPTQATERVLNSLNWTRCGDGSIRCDLPNQRDTEFKTTTPYNVKLSSQRAIDESVEKIASDFKLILDTLENVTVNKSMGIHFHFSGIKKFAVFYSREFMEQVKNRYLAICTNETERERVHNNYCKFEYDAFSNDRYRAVNILGAYQRHKTFEFRFFASTKNITVLKKYIRFVLELLKEVKETDYDAVKIEQATDASANKNEINLMV